MIEKNISTTSDIVQDISNELVFGQKHNSLRRKAGLNYKGILNSSTRRS